MINPAIMQLKMELANTKKEFSQNELKLKRLFFEIQTLSNPYYTTISSIKAEELEQCAIEMVNTKSNLLKMLEKIKELESQLGVE